MRMKMERKQLFVPVAIIILALGVTSTTTTTTKKATTTTKPKPTTTRPTTTTKPTTTRRTTTRWTTTSTAWTTGHTGLNLYGKMFTLSNSGGISFYSPYFSATPYYPRTTTTSWTTTTPHYPRTTTTPWTTPPSTQGVSVCLRYITDSPSATLTLSPSHSPLRLTLSDTAFRLYTNPYNYQSFIPNIKFFPNLYEEIWTRVCITMDSMKPVAQVFRGSNMSIKKMLRYKYVWSGEPVIDFSGFDGQVTDIQMWDYPLRYNEVYSYMSGGVYGSYQGSVLTWSYISYSSRGYTLLEDVYQWQGKQLINRWGIGRARKWEKAKKFVQLGESMESKTKQL